MVKGPPCSGKTHLLCHAIQRLGGVGGAGGAQVPSHSVISSAAGSGGEVEDEGEVEDGEEAEEPTENTVESVGWKMVFLHHLTHALDDTALLSRSK